MNKYLSKYLFYYPATLLKGENIKKHLNNYRRFQYYSGEDIKNYQARKILAIVNYAKKHSSFYRSLYSDCRLDETSPQSILTSFQDFPYITKSDLISSNLEMQTNFSWFHATKTTGGSTGEPVKILKNPDALARERAATWRAYEWANVNIGDMQARFWGVPHGDGDKFKAKAIDFIANRYRVSAFNLSTQALHDYYKGLLRARPRYLYGYVSVITIFAEFIRDNNLHPIDSLVAVITTSEVLSDDNRALINTVFNVPVFNEYGCGEVGSIAHECEHGKMHIMSDNIFIETGSGVGKPGEIVVTDFFNYSMPLIKYRLGDFATLQLDSCSCGKTLPTMSKIHGRAYDMIKTPEGKSIHPESMMYIFEAIQQEHNTFRQFQVIQNKLDHFDVYIVKNNNWNKNIESLISIAVKEKVSPSMRVSIHLVDEIRREKSGKMRVVKSTLAKK